MRKCVHDFILIILVLTSVFIYKAFVPSLVRAQACCGDGDCNASTQKCVSIPTPDCPDASGGKGQCVSNYETCNATKPCPWGETCINNLCYASGACFPAGTKINMSTGGRKNIEDVKIGDSVQGINDRGGKTVGTVTATQQPISNNLCTIKYTNGEDLQVTNSHPLYTQNGWKAIDPAAAALEDPGVPVTKLLVGDLMKNVNGTWPQIAGISCRSGTFQTYNFTVDNTHDYFAGGFLAHNKGGQRCNYITATKYGLGGQPVALYWTKKNGDTTHYVTQYGNPAVWQDSGCSGANCQYGDVVMWAGNYTMAITAPAGYNVSFLRLH